MDWSLLTFVVVGTAFFVAQTVKGVTGFGAGLITLPVLMAYLPPEQAILLLVAIDLVTGAWLVKDVFSSVARRLVSVMAVMITIGQWLGTGILFAVDPIITGRLLGAIVLVMGLRFVWKPVIPGRGEIEYLPSEHKNLLLQGAISAFFSGLMRGTVGAGGPPLVVFMRHHFIDQFTRAQLLILMLVGSIVLLLMLLGRGTDPMVLQLAPILLVPGLIGSRVGAWLAVRASRELFGRITGVILIGAGFALFLK